MTEEIKEFLHKVSDKITEIEDMAVDYGFANSFASCVVIGVVSENEDGLGVLNSVYSICIDSDEEMSRMVEIIEDNYNKVRDNSTDKSSVIKGVFDIDINLN